MRSIDLAAAAIAALVTIGLPAVGTAQPPGRDGGFGGHRGRPPERGAERFLEEHADELGLSAETREAIEKVIDESRQRADALRDAGREDHEALRLLLQRPMPDEKAVLQLTETIQKRRLEQSQNRMQAILDIRKLLTEAQRAKLVGIREARRARRARWGPMRACRGEISEICPGAAPGREMLQCLSEKWEDFSEACRGSFEDLGHRSFGRHPWEEGPRD